MHRGQILMRGYKDGIKVREKIPYKPYLFVPSDQGEYQTIFGEKLGRVDFGGIFDARGFIDKYKDVHGFKYYGSTNFVYPFINDEFPGKVDFDSSEISIGTIDIETDIIPGVPVSEMPKLASAQITAITMRKNERVVVIGCKPYKVNLPNVEYLHCTDEAEMLHRFLDVWAQFDLDVITGWNCVYENEYVATSQGLKKIKNIKVGDDLGNNTVLRHANTGQKDAYQIELINGHKIVCSEEHIFPICTKLRTQYKNKNTLIKTLYDSKVHDIDLDQDNFFIIPVNENVCSIPKTDMFYLLGMIYSDGSLWKNQKHVTIYNDNESIINRCVDICIAHGLEYDVSPVVYNNSRVDQSYRLTVKGMPLLSYIYNNGSKQLCVETLSQVGIDNFKLFLSGVVDGDGCVSKNVSFCDFNNNERYWQALLNWYNIDFSIYSNGHIICVRNVNGLDLAHNVKQERYNNIKSRTRLNSISKYIDQFVYDDFKLVRIKNITKLDVKVSMCDIETSTHYFNCAGFKTHNCTTFDIPYLVNRISKVLSEQDAMRMSPWRIVVPREFEFMGKVQSTYTLAGISVLDYLEVYKKFAYRQHENFRLNTIAHDVLGERKLDYSDYESLFDLYDKNYQLFIDYNIQDVNLVYRLEEKLGLLALVFTLAYRAKINYIDTFSSVRTWDVLIHNYLIDRKICVPQMKNNEKLGTIEGAYVKEPQKGRHEWVASFDVASEYPSLIIQYNISPETYVDKLTQRVPIDDILLKQGYNHLETKLRDENLTVTGAGCFFTRNKRGFLPQIMAELFQERQVYKKRMLQAESELQLIPKEEKELRRLKENEVSTYKNIQQAVKIVLNSGYGALTNAYFRWYNNDLAESITLGGQLTIKSAENALNRYMNKVCKTNNEDYIIAVDTDSVVGGSIIDVNGTKMTIAEFYDTCSGQFLKNDTFNENYIKKVDNCTTLTYNNELVQRPIKYVMKHKVKKKLFKITCNGKSVTVTEDHSVIVRNQYGKLEEIKPSQLDPRIHKIINVITVDRESKLSENKFS